MGQAWNCKWFGIGIWIVMFIDKMLYELSYVSK